MSFDSIYTIVAYRWDCTNDHTYVIGAHADLNTAISIAEHERDDRGGKYGVAVYKSPEDIENINRGGQVLMHYAPSMRSNEDGPGISWRLFSRDQVGSEVMLMFENGDLGIEKVREACERARHIEKTLERIAGDAVSREETHGN